MKVAVAWYREDQWKLLKDLAIDKEILPETHEEWLKEAKKSCHAFRKQKGLDVVKADVDVLVMFQWCQQQGFQMDGKARSRYASYLLSLRGL